MKGTAEEKSTADEEIMESDHVKDKTLLDI